VRSLIRLTSASLVTGLLAACAAPGERPVLAERLDRTTGTTVRVAGSPCRFVTETRAAMLDQIDFVDCHPFQTNRSGRYDYYVAAIIWRSVDAEGPRAPAPPGWLLSLATGPVELRGALAAPADAVLGSWPIDRRASQDEVRVFPVDLSVLRAWLPSSGVKATAADGAPDAPRLEALASCDATLQALLATAD
jgi:hypothetical protein